MKHLLFALAGLLAIAMVGCGLTGGDTVITQGEALSGTITEGDTEVDGWNSKVYKVNVQKGLEYFIQLSHDESASETVSIWKLDAEAFLVEVNSEVSAHTAAVKFEESGEQELFVRSRNAELPANYNLKFWLPGSS